ncbi:hypothetical protein ACJIZ3_010443 [Penstemon smallii]|uniref:Integrase catalytic domain-containing protein n=1 Tax=Penstemon smallii TaxID=265156 RepID=A0ABD3TG05_9LAMI
MTDDPSKSQSQSSSPPTFSLPPPSTLHTIKLTDENYLLWKTQILPYLKGHNLFGYIDGSFPPPQVLGEKSQPNLDFITWQQHDQAVLSLLVSSLSESIIAHVTSASTSREVWETLADLFAANSQAHVLQTTLQLASLKKGSDSVAVYYRRAKSLLDSLALAGKVVPPCDFIAYLLNGLDSDYNPVVPSITAHISVLTPAQVYSSLLQHESRLNHQLSNLSTTTEFSTNVSQHHSAPPSRGRGGRFPGRGGFRGRGGRGGQPNFSNRPVCQVCHKPGHTASTCYHRFDYNFQPPPPPSLSANYSSTLSSSPRPASSIDSSWYPDTATTHHFTNDFSNLSMSDNNVYFEFHSSFFCVKDSRTKDLLLHGPTKDGMYVFPAPSSPPTAFVAERVSPDQWHSRLGHPSMSTVRHLIYKESLPIKGSSSSILCPACCQAKAHQLPYTPSHHRSSEPLQLLFTDVWGPSPSLSRGGFRYYVSFVDDFSRYTWIFPLKRKSDVSDVFINFKRHVEKLLNTSIRSIQSDWGGEFRSLTKVLAHFGITHRKSCPYAHSQNGSVERKHRHIVETGLALLSFASLPKYFWSDAFTTAVYLINRLPTPSLLNKSPYETLFQKKPDYLFLKTFGCQCWPNLRPYNKHKMDPRSLPCIFIGYSTSHHGYMCLHVPTSRIYISRDVIFDENLFPYAEKELGRSLSRPFSNATLPFQLPNPSRPATSVVAHSLPPLLPTPLRSPQTNQPNSVDTTTHASPHHASTYQNPSPLTSQIDSPTSPSSSTTSLPITTRPKSSRACPKVRTDGTIPWPPPRAHLTASSDPIPDEPNSISQALKFPDWRLAMQREFDALLSTQTWSLVPPSPEQNIVGCRWVFKTKFLADGTIERRKARLVARGFHQLEGLDYNETFSPVVKPTTIRLVLSVAVSLNWPINQLDVQNAFLHGNLNENVYMTQPPGFTHPDFPTYVCKLNRAIYGLKQAPRAWYERLSSKLLELGFVVSKSDTSLFIYRHNSVILYLLVYVDDIIVTGSCPNAISDLVASLGLAFPIKNLGGLHYFLGLECKRTDMGMHISQRKYIFYLLKRANMGNCNPVNSPMAPSTKLSAFDSVSFENPELYRSLVGSLQYLSFTRPDIAFSVNKSVKRILQYLKGTIDHGLFLRSSVNPSLAVYSDADWAGSLDDRKSTGGFCVFFGKNLVSWRSKKQSTIARSSTEAEYKALAHATCEVIWLQSLLTDLGIFASKPPILFCDNLGATYLSKNPIMHSRTKHVDINYHFVRDRVQSRAIQISFLSSKDQLADIFTKPLSSPRFSTLRTSLSVVTNQLGSRGRIGVDSTQDQNSSTS